jgi:hypothetical protein
MKAIGALLAIVGATGLVFAAGAWCGAREIHPSYASVAPIPHLPKATEVRVPRAAEAITIDGELDEASWQSAALTRGFVRGDGSAARPYSEARLTWGDGNLYVALYAADEDIRSDDTFHLFFDGPNGAHGLDVTAEGKLTTRLAAWKTLPTAAQDTDGTLNDASDDDEEWIVEVAIPLAELGLKGESGERVSFAARRCDTPKGGRRTCGHWGGEVAGVLVLD